MKKPMKEDPELPLMDGLMSGARGEHPSTAIERSEARGQQQLVMSESIPSKWGGMFGTSEAALRHAAERDAILVEMGFELGEPFPDDPLFRPANLPEGWRKRATGHAMHSDILDDQGFARVGMFYKAAFYDRKAHLSLNRRLTIGIDMREDFDPNKRNRVIQAAMPAEEDGRDRFLILARFDLEVAEDDAEKWDKFGKLEATAQRWLDAHYPDHMDPLAYWSEELDGELVVRE